MPGTNLKKHLSSFWDNCVLRLRCIRQSCWIFCCPPIPKSMIRKAAFQPPPPSYHFTTDDGQKITKPYPGTREIFPLRIVMNCDKKPKLSFAPDLIVQENLKKADLVIQENLKRAECFFINTSRGNWIPCLFYPCPFNPAKYTIIFSHANAQDLGLTAKRWIGLSILLQCNICFYDYSGYGLATGKASEKHMYADIRAVYEALLKRYKLIPSEIIVMGQSLGVPATVDLAKEENLAGVVLISGFCSALHILDNSRTGCFRKMCTCADQFNSLDKMEEICSPVLMIHGQKDKNVPFLHGVALYEKCKNPVPPLWLWYTFCKRNKCSHNIDYYSETWIRIQRFISDDLQGGELYSQIYRNKLERAFAEGGIVDMHANCLSTGAFCLSCLEKLRNKGNECEKESMFRALFLAFDPMFLMAVEQTSVYAGSAVRNF